MDFPDQNSMMNHLYMCSQLPKGQVRCLGCGKLTKIEKYHASEEDCNDPPSCKDRITTAFSHLRSSGSSRASHGSVENEFPDGSGLFTFELSAEHTVELPAYNIAELSALQSTPDPYPTRTFTIESGAGSSIRESSVRHDPVLSPFDIERIQEVKEDVASYGMEYVDHCAERPASILTPSSTTDSFGDPFNASTNNSSVFDVMSINSSVDGKGVQSMETSPTSAGSGSDWGHRAKRSAVYGGFPSFNNIENAHTAPEITHSTNLQFDQISMWPSTDEEISYPLSDGGQHNEIHHSTPGNLLAQDIMDTSKQVPFFVLLKPKLIE